MRNIQEVGLEILGKTPKSFYVFTGPEYGIKMKYIETLKELYGKLVEADSVSSVLSTMKTKHIIPLQPSVYVVRYDEDFISSLNEKTESVINQCKIIGTVICIYDQPKHSTKVAKYLPNLSVSIDSVNSTYIEKYLHSDFPKLNDRFIKIASTICKDYNQAKNLCRCMIQGPLDDMYKLSDDEIVSMFGFNDCSTEAAIKQGIASRNFNYLIQMLDTFDGDFQTILYTTLSTMIELDKCMDNRGSQSTLSKYSKLWNREDVYYMFMNTYEALKKSRTYAITDIKEIIIWLFSLLKFNPIPSKEVLM